MARWGVLSSPLSSHKISEVVISLFFCLSAVYSSGQIQDLNDTTAPPVPGRNYVGVLNETVDPATGALSVKIDLPVPPGRKLSVPVAIEYNSAAAWHLNVGTFPPTPPNTWPGGNSVGASTFSFLSSGGWSLSVTQLTAQTYSWVPPHPVQNGPKTCDAAGSFMFADPSGTMHKLPLVHIFAPSSQACNNPQPPFSEMDTASDGIYQATITNSGTGNILVAGPDGTVFTFGAYPVGSSSYDQLPMSIEDRNGNLLTINNPSNSSPAIADDAGRTAVSVNNFRVSPTAVTVAGLSPAYQIQWTTVSPSGGLLISYRNLNPSVSCANPPSVVALQSGLSVVQYITLPNGKKYTISYDPKSGLINKIVYPSGGYVSYVWGTNPQSQGIGYNDVYGSYKGGCAFLYDTPAISQRTVSFDGSTTALQQTFTYGPTTWDLSHSPYWPIQWTAKTTKVVTTDVKAVTTSQKIYTYGPVTIQPPPAVNPDMGTSFIDQMSSETSIAYYGYSQNGSYPLLRTETKIQNVQPPLLICDMITDDQGNVSGTTYNYGQGGVLTEKQEFAIGALTSGSTCQSHSGSPTRETKIAYQSFAATPIYTFGPSIFDRPSSVQVYAGLGTTLMSEIDYTYDGTAVGSVSSLTGHDETNYSSSYNNRGNATTKTVKCLSGCSDSVTTYTFDETGQIASMMDPCGNGTCSDVSGTNHTTTYSYSDNYLPGSGTPPGTTITNAYLTTVTHPTVGSVTTHEYFQYAYSDGKLTASQDDNDKTAGALTTYTYADSLRRMTETDYPDGGQVKLSYNDTAPSPTVTKTVLISASPGLSSVTTTTMDGMGHTVKAALSDPEGTDTSETTYDGFGRVRTQTNPHRSASSTTDGTRQSSYDAMGRLTSVVQSDGSTLSTSYSGNCTTTTDEIGNTRTSCTDGLGRIIKVLEAPTSLNYETDYQYDVLNNLLCAVQKGTDTTTFTNCASAQSSWRPRSFQYDSLSRIISATNPETGTVSYSYDLNGNAIQKKAPRPNQTNPATTSTVNFCYDALSRLTSKAYNTTSCPPSSAQATYTYDQGTNNVGRRTGMTDSPGSASWTYDIMGRVASETRVTANVTKSTSYIYNQDGSVSSITYPSGRVVSYAYSTAGRSLSAIDSTGPINYLTSLMYAPPGQLATALNGYVSGGFAGIQTSNIYGTRLQPILLSASAGSSLVFRLCYDFHMKVAVNSSPCTFSASSIGDNGDVFQIVNKRDDNRTQNFLYDALNRVQQAYTNGANWGETFGPTATNPGVPPSTPGIDAWANLSSRSSVNGKTYYEALNCPANNNNQLTTCSQVYDAAGNVTSDGSLTYTYDTENHMTKAGTNDLYTYDGDGNRVKKSVAGTVTLYWYGATGNVLDETNSTGNLISEYIFFNGKRVARRDADNSVKYYFSDNLGSASVVTNNTGTILSESDYYPYGGEIVITGGDSNHYKFTGKERDSETGLDNFGARYMASSLGRFMTPDWATRPTTVPYATFGDPQSLNLYTYVANNPLNRVDPDGHCVYIADQAPAGTGSALQHGLCAGQAADKSNASAGSKTDEKQKEAQNTQQAQTVVFSDRANAAPYQDKPGAAAERTVDYEAGKMDKNGHIDSHDIDHNATLTLHEKLDPNSKSKSADIAGKPDSQKGIYKDYQFVPGGQAYRVLRDWKVGPNSANVLDMATHKAFRFELTTFDTYAKPPIKTEYTNTAPF